MANWRERALHTINQEFVKLRATNPYMSVAQIMEQIKPLAAKHFGNNYPTKIWREACWDYQRDAEKLYER